MQWKEIRRQFLIFLIICAVYSFLLVVFILAAAYAVPQIPELRGKILFRL